MSNIIPYPQAPVAQVPRLTWIEVMERGVELAEIIANTDFVPRGLRGNQPAILAAILFGHEVGLQPIAALAHVAVIEGKPTLSAEAQRGLILAAGHEFTVEESTVTRAVVAGRRRDGRTTTRVTWTIDDAKRARIAGRQNWQAYPRQMLVARASAELARMIFADVIGGMPATEEFDEVAEQAEPAGEVEQQEEVKKPTRRRKRPAPSVPPEPVDVEPAEPDTPSKEATGMLFALFTQKGIHEREARLAYARNVLDRNIDSARELSALDTSRIIDALKEEPDASNVEAELPEAEQAVLDDLRNDLGATEVEQPPLPGE